MRSPLLITASAAVLAIATPVAAQTTGTTPSVGTRIGQILGNILGIDNRADSSLEGQWTANRRPLGNQAAEFDARVTTDLNAGRINAATAARLRTDYAALVQLESTYGADGTYTTAERSDLTTRYNTLLSVLTTGRYSDTPVLVSEVANGQLEFNRRVDAQVAKRKITRGSATQLKADYAALVRVETGYLSDGVITEAERADLDARLDALDVRVGDVAYTVPVTYKSRLEAIRLALPSSGLTLAARNQIVVEHGDLVRLEAAYARLTPTADEKAYLEKRLADLELRARVKR